MADATFVRKYGDHLITAGAASGIGEIWQLNDGRAAYQSETAATGSGDQVEFRSTGHVTVTKTAGIILLAGGKVFWDHSANAATYRKTNDRDFYIGRAVDDAASIDVTVVVDLNVDPPYDIDIATDPFTTAIVGTQGLNTMGVFRRGGAHDFLVSSTSEAQKLDILSVDGFDKAANAIVEFAFRVVSDGAGTAVDVSVGIANDTHGTDADSITDSVFMHLNANDTAIYFESDDGSTEVTATDSTKTYTESAAAANRKEVWMDMRNPADVQVYVNGENVLPSSVFNVNASSAIWKLLAHIEKTSSTDAYSFSLDFLRVRFAEQD